MLAPDLSASERAFLEAHLRGLTWIGGPDSTYGNVDIAVIDGSSGHYYYNKPSLSGAIRIGPATTPLTRAPEIARRASRQIVPFSIDPPSLTTGANRLIWSFGKQPPSSTNHPIGTYSYGTVDLLCTNGNFVQGDAGYIYYGGDSGRMPIDSGMQYDWNRDISGTIHYVDSYELFMAFGAPLGFMPPGIAYKLYDNGKWDLAAPKLEPLCNQQVHMEFEVQDGTVSPNIGKTIFINSVVLNNGTGQAIHLVYIGQNGTDHTFYGWNATCTLCNLKRATSIAQKSGQQNLQNGDSFKVTWLSQKLACGFLARAACAVNNPPDEPWDVNHVADCTDFPSPTDPTGKNGYIGGECQDQTIGSILVSGFTYDGEQVNIQLPNPPPVLPTPTPHPPSYVRLGGIVTNSATQGITMQAAVTNNGAIDYSSEANRGCHFRYQVFDSNNALVYDTMPASSRCLQSLDWFTTPAGTTRYDSPHNWSGSHSGNYTVLIYWIGEGATTTVGAVAI